MVLAKYTPSGHRAVSAEPTPSSRRPGIRTQDRESERWVEQLHSGHPRREQTLARLHEVLLRIAIFELSRRRGRLASITGPEFDDLAQQAANDALMNVLAKLDEFRG